MSDQYVQGQKLSNTNNAADFALLAEKIDNGTPEFVSSEAQLAFISTTEPMDEVSCISNSFDAKLGLFPPDSGKVLDGQMKTCGIPLEFKTHS